MDTTFGRYRLLERLGEGGMAEVFKAKSFGVEGFEKVLVIKRIHPKLVDVPRFVDMFVHEAKLAVRLSHANIVQVFDLGRVEHAEGQTASYFIAMEYVAGLDLASVLKRCRRQKREVPVGLAVYVAGEVAKALDHAHRRRDEDGRPLGIVHRDISPQNILISWEGEVKVTDFGIAKARAGLDDLEEEDTGARKVKGKLAYMSPEQSRSREVDNRSDLFSLGTVLYEMLAGSNPFSATSATETLRRIGASEHPPLPVQRADVPDAIAEVVETLLARMPDDRFADAGRLHEALLGFRYASGDRFGARELADFVEPFRAEDGSPAAMDGLAEDETRTHEATPVEIPLRPTGPRGDGSTHSDESEPAERREVSMLVLVRSKGTEPDAEPPGVRVVDAVLRHGGELVEDEPTQLVALFGLRDADGRDTDAAVRAALVALRTRGVESAGIHVGRISVDATGAALPDERLAALTASAQALARLTEGRVVVSDLAGRLVRGAFLLEEPPRDPARALPEAALLIGGLRPHPVQGRFVGRRADLRTIGELLARAGKRSAQIATVVGGMGLGKSRLLIEVERRIQKGGYDIGFYLAKCPKNGSEVTFSGLTEMLRVLCGVQEGDDAARVRELSPRLRALGLQDDEASLVLERLGARGEHEADLGGTALDVVFGRMLRGLCDDRVHVFAWDDAHFMDAASQEAIVAALRGAHGRSTPPEPPSSAPESGGKSRLRALFLLAARGGAPRAFADLPGHKLIELGELGEEEVSKLVANRLGARLLPRELLQLCQTRAGGHPLFLEELLRELLDAAAVSVLSGAVSTRLEGAKAIPRTLRALVAERTARLGARDRKVLQAAALLGDPVETPVLAELSGVPMPDLHVELEGRAALRAPGAPGLAQFLQSRGPQMVTFSSPLYAEIVLEGIPVEHRRAQHAAAANAYLAVVGQGSAEHAERIAHHLYEAGELDRAAAFFARAAGRQIRLGQRDAAIRALLRTFALATLDAHPVSELLAWLEQLADAVFALREAPDLSDAASRVLARIDAEGSAIERGRARLALARAFGSINRFDDAFALLDESSALAASLAGERTDEAEDLHRRATATVMEMAARRGDFARAKIAAEALEASFEADDPIVLYGMAFVHAASGDAARALAIAKRAETIPTSEGDLVRAVARERRKALVHAYRRDFKAALEPTLRAVELARAASLRFDLAASLHNLGDTLLRLGDLPRAYASFAESRELSETAGFDRLVSSNRAFLAYLDGRRTGDATEAASTLESLVEYARTRGYVNDVVEGRYLLGALYKELGMTREARVRLEEAMREAESFGNRLLAGDAREALEQIRIGLDESTEDGTPSDVEDTGPGSDGRTVMAPPMPNEDEGDDGADAPG